MAKYNRRRNKKRGQQVQRQLVMGTGILILAIATIVGYNVQSANKEEPKVKETSAKVEDNIEKTPEAETQKKDTLQQRIDKVKANATTLNYPPNVIELLNKNTETIQFVENYGEKKDNPCPDTIGTNLEKGQIPLLLQWDERWGYAPYGTSIIAVSGCGPTCMSMVVAGLTGDASVTPDKVAAYGSANGYVDEENNTLWRFMQEAPANWNVKARELPLVESMVQAELQAGHPIICSVTEGDFTTSGHFIVLTGYNNGTVTVNDPFSNKNSAKLWTFSAIQDQIKAMWVYSL